MARGSLHLSMFVQGDHLHDERDVCNIRVLVADDHRVESNVVEVDHRRMLGNGMCNRPVALDCSFESACERCNFFETGPQFIPILRRQRDHAVEQDQAERVELFEGLIKDIDGAT